MRLSHRGPVSVALAGTAAFALIAAAAPSASPVGTATTSVHAVSLEVLGIDAGPAIDLLQGGTYASTDPNAEGNLLGAPFATATLVPATIGGEAIGAATARSDDGGSASTDQVDSSGVVSSPVQLTASAAEDAASAVIGVSTTQLSALTDILGLTVSASGLSSSVDGETAQALQGISVEGLSVSLGDLLPADVLGELPIDVLLDLLASLPVGVPDVEALVDTVTALVADVRAGVEAIAADAASLTAALDALADANAELDAAQVAADAADAAVTAAEGTVAAAEATVTGLTADLADIGNSTVLNLIGVASSCLGDLDVAGCLANLQASTQASLDAANATLAAAQADLAALVDAAAAATAALGPLQDVVDTLIAAVEAIVADVQSLVDTLLADLQDLVAQLTNLDASLADVIAGLADAELIGLDALEVVSNAVATADASTSTATVTCAVTGLTVAGIDLGDSDCADNPVSGALSGAIGSLNDVLGALPLAGDLVPTVTVDLVPGVTESVVEDGDTITSTAVLDVLSIELPSVDLDPSSLVDGLLDTLTADLVGEVLGQLPAVQSLIDEGAATAANTLQDVVDLGAVLGDVETQLGDVLALLPDGLGLTALTTPGFSLDVDPSSTATFTRGSAPAPAPEPAGPTLPATGGGAVVLAAMGLGGAFSLRRRR